MDFILVGGARGGPTFRKIFEFCFNYKLYWVKYGMKTPLLDKFVFSKIKKLLGGRMDFILVGGAPLSQTTHDFIRVCLGAIVVQGYSLTESTCTGTVMENHDVTTGTVGKPMTGLKVKLVDWEEGNYKVTDRPNPRGEIVLGGDTISKDTSKCLRKLKKISLKKMVSDGSGLAMLVNLTSWANYVLLTERKIWSNFSWVNMSLWGKLKLN